MATSSGVKLPPYLDLQSSIAYIDWKCWKTQFKFYLEVNQRASWSSLPISDAGRNNYVKVKKAIEKYINHCLNEVFEQYVFNKHFQEVWESFDHLHS
ncbi:hypothetical protein PR048_019825 [Dryococelus australis]|uniref:Uncharacterized protein n=1 Tax=Dryococelus australis TaxID=614101 RepID=A0ABQ9H4M9_9NEOP|nr:hypothetical protein PR048_019825 [Dryococelus australis]